MFERWGILSTLLRLEIPLAWPVIMTGVRVSAQMLMTKLSDLARLPRSELTFCVESEFASRNDGFVPMPQTYGLSPDALGRVTHLDTGVIYTATANGDCNFRRGVHPRRSWHATGWSRKNC